METSSYLSDLVSLLQDAESSNDPFSRRSDQNASNEVSAIASGPKAISQQAARINSQNASKTASETSTVDPGNNGQRSKKGGLVKDIWNDEELEEQQASWFNSGQDGRPTPEYKTFYRQLVRTEDVYLGLNGKSPGITNDADEFVVNVHLPNTSFPQIELILQRDRLEVRCPNYLLIMPLPNPVDEAKSKASWNGKAETLQISMPISFS